jgi:hypothetical protein
VCTLTPSRRLNARPATTGEAAIDSRIDEACSREHREKVIQYFEILYEIYIKFCFEPCNRGPHVLFRTMQPRSARAREQSALSKFCEHAFIFCAMTNVGIATGSWRFARRVHRGVMRTWISNKPCRTSTIRTVKAKCFFKFLTGIKVQITCQITCQSAASGAPPLSQLTREHFNPKGLAHSCTHL